MTESDAEPGRETLSEPSFAIPRRPERRYSRGGGLSYEGTTVFALTPDSVPEGSDEGETDADDPDAWLCALTERVLEADPYTYGDWFDLPMPVFLVHDRETGDVFRVAIRGGTIEFHVLPETEPSGLRALYERLCAATEDGVTENGTGRGPENGSTEPARGRAAGSADVTWDVTCRTDAN